MNKTIEQIAKDELDILCLETRKSDSLDFYTTSVWQVKAALEAAYKAGYADGLANGAKAQYDYAKRMGGG